MFCKIILNSKVIVKSILDPDNDFFNLSNSEATFVQSTGRKDF